ncbi:uncharacterized protein PAN0_005c2647 [Moesziomyces antarcticus]|uniref:Uncharacterized protein n=2 Tax=Pseudozyma antarctica TaxID=84753 RepID=A0A5C3FNJ6_PSEA2|nr:uncharacterized protein PAN0_005c2647 [Moesziomyces antarcticus]GAK64433.1 conserved hypothetical protein [Moesziomyces antarcticus]SPO45061.1 uncharacterized protein PSANT_02747 [Moesziomyces antarcticus]
MKWICAVLVGAAGVYGQTAGVPGTINVGNGQSVATFPSGLGGLSTGTTAVFTPGAASSASGSPYYVATDAAQSSTLASLNTHYSQGISAATPTTGPPTGISTGIPGGFTGTNTVSILDGQITTIPNAATTYTGPRSTTASAAGASSNALANFDTKPLTAMAAMSFVAVAAAAYML